MSTGQTLRAEGIDAVIAADTAVNRGYACRVADAIEHIGAAGFDFTADDVRRWVERHYPDLQPHSPNVLPATIGGLAAAGRIEAVGWAKSPRTSRRSGWGRVWRLTPQAPSGGRSTAPTPAPPGPSTA